MAIDKIKSSDLVESDFIDNIIKELAKLKPVLEGLATDLKNTLEASKPPENPKEFKALIDDVNKLKEVTKTYKDVTVEISKAEKENIRLKVEAQLERAKLRKETRLEIQSTKESQGAYAQMNAQLEINRTKVKNLLASKKQLTDADKELINETQKLDKELKAIDKSLGQNQRNVGNYEEAVATANMSIGEMRKELRALQEKGFGNLTQDQINKTKLRMADLTDSMGKAQQEIKAMSNDTLPALSQSVQMVSQSANSYVQTMLMFGDVSEEDRKSLQNLLKMTTVLSTAVGTLTSVQQAYISGAIKSNIQKTISTIKTAALTTANFLAATSQAAWTLAVKAFNTTVYNIPVFGWLLAIIGAIIGVVVLLYNNWNKLTSLFKSSEKEIENNGKALEKYNKQLTEMNKLHKENINNIEFQIKLLKAQGGEIEEIRKLESDLINERIKNAKEKLVLDLKEFQRLAATGKMTKEELEEKKKYFTDEIFSYKKLLQERKILDAQHTTDRKKENEKRLKDELEAQKKLKEETLKGIEEINNARLKQLKTEQESAKLLRDARSRNLTDEIEREKVILKNSFYDKLAELKKQGLLSNELEIELKKELNRKLAEIDEKRKEDIRTVAKVQEVTTEGIIDSEAEAIEKRKAMYQTLANQIQSTFQNITNELMKQDQFEAQTLDRRLDRQAKSLEFQQELAKRGIENNLAEEKKALAEAEAERERFELRRQRRERRRTILQTYLKLIEKEDPIPALGKAVTIAAGLTGFYDGTDSVGEDNAVRYKKSGRDPFIAKLEKGEMILNPNESNFVRNNVGNRKDLINFINQHKNNTSTTSHNVVTKVQEVKLVADVDSIGQVIISLAEKGKKTNTTFSKNHRI